MKRSVMLPGLTLALVVLVSCGDDDDGVVSPKNDQYQPIINQFHLTALPSIPYPATNPFQAERVALGQLLFWDPILGGESAPWIKSAAGRDPYRDRANDMACATCHHASFAFADGRELSAGVGGAQFRDTDLGPQRVYPGASLVTGSPVGIVPRNAPSCLNTAYNGRNSIVPVAESFQFLDGRVTHGLEEQARNPITSRDEMAGDAYGRPVLGEALTADAIRDSVTARIRHIPEYVSRFRQAFPGEVTGAQDITIDHITRAIAAFERELVTPNSRYDRFVTGQRDVFTGQEKTGFELFFGKGLCGDCHSGPMLSDFAFHVQGVGDGYDRSAPGFGGKNGQGGDWGRFHADPVAFADQKYFFRTMTVRGVEVTGPYFHSGSAGTLREVVEFYNRGGRGDRDIPDATLAAAGVTRDEEIRALSLTDQEMDDIVAFMKTTTAPLQAGPLGIDLGAIPPRVPSGLLPPGIPTPAGPGPFKMDPIVSR